MKQKLGINFELGRFDSPEQHIQEIVGAGFNACFYDWHPELPYDCDALVKEAGQSGLVLQSVHAPFDNVESVWEEGAAGDREIDILTACLRVCERQQVPIMIVHPIKGMDKCTPNMRGIGRFEKLVRTAENSGVRLVFENVEGLVYLQWIIRELGSSPAVGYCWDTGHELCYNFGMDIPALYGEKLICTHLNDNLGQTDPAKKTVTWLDDAHLFPFDGVVDWPNVAARLDRANYQGILTFELTLHSKPGRNTHSIYEGLNDAEILKLAYRKACLLAALRKQ